MSNGKNVKSEFTVFLIVKGVVPFELDAQLKWVLLSFVAINLERNFLFYVCLVDWKAQFHWLEDSVVPLLFDKEDEKTKKERRGKITLKDVASFCQKHLCSVLCLPSSAGLPAKRLLRKIIQEFKKERGRMVFCSCSLSCSSTATFPKLLSINFFIGHRRSTLFVFFWVGSSILLSFQFFFYICFPNFGIKFNFLIQFPLKRLLIWKNSTL